MPTQIDTPSAVGAFDTQWHLYGPGAVNKVQAVATNDGDNSVITAFSQGVDKIQTYVFPVIAGITDPVTEAAIYAFARQYQRGDAEKVFTLWWNGVETATPNWGGYIRDADPAYYPCSYGAAGAGLALSAVNGQHGFRMKTASGTGWEVWVTHVYRYMVYAFAAPGAATSADIQFAHLISSIALLIGGNLLLREMPAVSRALGRIRLLPDEYEPAWRAWRAYKHPAWGI